MLWDVHVTQADIGAGPLIQIPNAVANLQPKHLSYAAFSPLTHLARRQAKKKQCRSDWKMRSSAGRAMLSTSCMLLGIHAVLSGSNPLSVVPLVRGRLDACSAISAVMCCWDRQWQSRRPQLNLLLIVTSSRKLCLLSAQHGCCQRVQGFSGRRRGQQQADGGRRQRHDRR